MTSDELKREISKVDDEISSLNNMQHALKILLNSLYGAAASPYFRYYDSRIAEGITQSSQLALYWMNRKFNEFLNKKLGTQSVDYVIYNDTDSGYLHLESVVNRIAPNATTVGKINAMDKFCSEILSPFIEKSFIEMAEYMNATENKMVMGRDTLSEKAIFCAKKKYVLLEHDSEGVRWKEPKKKVIGLQMIQSSTPKIMKEKLKIALDKIIDEGEDALQEYVLQEEKEFRQYSVEEISIPTGINGLSEYSDPRTIYRSGCPIHVRGSLLHNKLLIEKGLDKEIEPIKESSKIRYCYLKLPNPIRENIIAFSDNLPVKFELHEYIDWENQFERTFLMPLKTILNAIKWTPYKSNSMEDMFG